MKIKCLVSGMLAGLVFHVHADFCDQLSGHWQGIFTIKDPALCELFNGCTHQIKAHAYPDDFFDETNFEVNVTPSSGVAGLYYITCRNSIISPPKGFSGEITAACDLSEQCEMVYEDSRLLCKMTKNQGA